MSEKKYSSIMDLTEEKYICKFNPGDHIIEQGKKPTCIVYIESGSAQVVHTNAKGKSFTFSEVKPGEYIGIHSLLNKENYFATIIAKEPTTAYIITEQALSNAMNKSEAVILQVIRQLCSKIGLVESRMKKFSQKNIKEQIVELLLTQLNNTGNTKNLFTIDELANFAGTTGNYIYKILSELTKIKAISIKKRNIVILNKEKLESFIHHADAV
jgi:CRP-like cAMP-binding protein